MRIAVASISALVLTAAAAHAVEATFLGKGTYTASKAECTKLKALAKGTPRGLNTVPDTLSAQGHLSWEGGCKIAAVTPMKVRQMFGIRSWKVDLVCGEGAIENQKVAEVWTKNSDGTISVKRDNQTQKFTLCAAGGKR